MNVATVAVKVAGDLEIVGIVRLADWLHCQKPVVVWLD